MTWQKKPRIGIGIGIGPRIPIFDNLFGGWSVGKWLNAPGGYHGPSLSTPLGDSGILGGFGLLRPIGGGDQNPARAPRPPSVNKAISDRAKQKAAEENNKKRAEAGGLIMARGRV